MFFPNGKSHLSTTGNATFPSVRGTPTPLWLPSCTHSRPWCVTAWRTPRQLCLLPTLPGPSFFFFFKQFSTGLLSDELSKHCLAPQKKRPQNLWGTAKGGPNGEIHNHSSLSQKTRNITQATLTPKEAGALSRVPVFRGPGPVL